MTAALSVAAGCQVSRRDRPTRTSFERVDAEPDVTSFVLGTHDIGLGEWQWRGEHPCAVRKTPQTDAATGRVSVLRREGK